MTRYKVIKKGGFPPVRGFATGFFPGGGVGAPLPNLGVRCPLLSYVFRLLYVCYSMLCVCDEACCVHRQRCTKFDVKSWGAWRDVYKEGELHTCIGYLENACGEIHRYSLIKEEPCTEMYST